MPLNHKTLAQSRYGLEPDEWRIEGERGFIDDKERLQHLRKMRSDFGAIEGTSKLLLKRMDARIEQLDSQLKAADAFCRILADSPEEKARVARLKRANGTFENDEDGGVSEQRTGIAKWFPWIIS